MENEAEYWTNRKQHAMMTQTWILACGYSLVIRFKRF